MTKTPHEIAIEVAIKKFEGMYHDSGIALIECFQVGLQAYLKSMREHYSDKAIVHIMHSAQFALCEKGLPL